MSVLDSLEAVEACFGARIRPKARRPGRALRLIICATPGSCPALHGQNVEIWLRLHLTLSVRQIEFRFLQLMAVADGNGIPIAIHLRSASPAEVTLVNETLWQSFLTESALRLIADRAYDSDRLVRELADKSIQPIAPHCSHRERITQDDGKRSRSRRRWKIERVLAWLKNCRKIARRWDRLLSPFLRFVYLRCIRTLLKRYF